MCTRYRSCVPNMDHVSSIRIMHTQYGSCVLSTDHAYPIRITCTQYRSCVPDTDHAYLIWIMCTQYGSCEPSFATIHQKLWSQYHPQAFGHKLTCPLTRDYRCFRIGPKSLQMIKLDQQSIIYL